MEMESINYCLDIDNVVMNEMHDVGAYGDNWSGHSISTGSNGGIVWDPVGFPTGCIRPGIPSPDINSSYSAPEPKYNPGFFANGLIYGHPEKVRGVLYDGGWDSRNASFIWVKSEDGQTLYKVGLICKDNPSVCNYLLQNFNNIDESILDKLRGVMDKTFGVINLNRSKGRSPEKNVWGINNRYLDCITFKDYKADAGQILEKIFVLILYGREEGPRIVYDEEVFNRVREHSYIQTPKKVSPYIPNFDGQTNKYINLENELSTSIIVNSQINLNNKFTSNNLGRVNITIIDQFNF
jgi:hypothetical protein